MSNNIPRTYPPYRSNTTKQTIDALSKHELCPVVEFFDPFVEGDTLSHSFNSSEFIDEWARTSQILLFDSFYEKMYEWTRKVKKMKKNIAQLKHNRRLIQYRKKRQEIETRAMDISTDLFHNLPDDILRIVWSYVDVEVRNKYFIGKYFAPIAAPSIPSPLVASFTPVANLNTNDPHPLTLTKIYFLLNKLNIKTIKKIYAKTGYCYHGHCMQKKTKLNTVPPSAKKHKHELIMTIIELLDDFLNIYLDPIVITNVHYGKVFPEDSNENKYYGCVYPISFYEKKNLRLWLNIAVAFSLFLAPHLS